MSTEAEHRNFTFHDLDGAFQTLLIPLIHVPLVGEALCSLKYCRESSSFLIELLICPNELLDLFCQFLRFGFLLRELRPIGRDLFAELSRNTVIVSTLSSRQSI
jgi:hypothetical protein